MQIRRGVIAELRRGVIAELRRGVIAELRRGVIAELRRGVIAELRRGVVKGFDSGSYEATVQVAGSLSVWLEAVPVARNIPSAEMVIGRNCALIFFDPTNPSDAVLIAVWQ